MMLPRLEELATKVAGKAVVAKHDVDSDPSTPSSMRIMSIPTMILFKDGQPVEKWVGAQEVSVLESKILQHV
jgi:thioredoxin 1